MAEHHFILNAKWPGGRNDIGRIEAGAIKTEVSIPKAMGGPGVGTNPDDLLLGSAATCYIITLVAMLERSRVDKETLTMESEAIVDVTDGIFTYKKIIHRPIVHLSNAATDSQIRLTEKLVKKADSSCMISRAIKGNVTVEIEPTITICS